MMDLPRQSPASRLIQNHPWWFIFAALTLCLVSWSVGVLGVMSSSGGEKFPPFLVTQQDNGVHFEGTISTESMSALLSSIRARQASFPGKEVTVWLESGGGDVEATLWAAAMIPNLHVTMAVGHRGYCGSACVPLFLAADHRFAAPTAGFGLHAVFCQGRLSDLECLAEKAYGISDIRYQAFVKIRDPALYAVAVTEHAFTNPPDNLVCYTYPNGADHPPVSERQDDVAHGDCALAFSQLTPMMEHDFLGRSMVVDRDPVSLGSRIKILLLYLLFQAQNTSRHRVPFPEKPLPNPTQSVVQAK